MDSLGAILIAAQEGDFLWSTMELLRQRQYECQPAVNAEKALKALSEEHFDLLIGHTEVLGENGLEQLRAMRSAVPDLPAIVVTAAPSVETAVAAVELRAVAYLHDPVDRESLLAHAASVMQTRPARSTLTRVLENLREAAAELEQGRPLRPEAGQPTVDLQLMRRMVRNLGDCIVELMELTRLGTDDSEPRSICELVRCPEWRNHRTAYRDVIQVIQETKRRFKSKELADLRDRMEYQLQKLGE